MPNKNNILDDFSEAKNEFSDNVIYSEKTSLNFSKDDSYATFFILNISVFLFLFLGNSFSLSIELEHRIIISVAAFFIFYIPTFLYFYARYRTYKTTYELTKKSIVIIELHQEINIPFKNIKTLIPHNYGKVKHPFAGTKILNAGEEGKKGIEVIFKKNIKYQTLFFPSKKDKIVIGPLETNELFEQLEKQMKK